jgi:hypothetical protein
VQVADVHMAINSFPLSSLGMRFFLPLAIAAKTSLIKGPGASLNEICLKTYKDFA